MVYNDIIKGYFISLRSVEENDAEKILKWRTDENISKYLHKTDNDIKKQREWIKEQRAREGDYYFMIINSKTNEAVGTIGLYNIDREKNEGEFGRWICFSPLYSLDSAILIYEFGFEILNLQRIITRTVNNNLPVINFHKRFGANFVRNVKDEKSEFTFVEYEILRSNYKKIESVQYKILKNFIREDI